MTKEQALELHLVGGEFALCDNCEGSGQEIDVDHSLPRWVPCSFCTNGCVPTMRYVRALDLLGAEAAEPASHAADDLRIIRDFERDMNSRYGS